MKNKPDLHLSKRDRKKIRDAYKFAADMDGDTLADRILEMTWAAASKPVISVAEAALLNVLTHEIKFRLSKLERFEQKHRHRR